MDGAANRLVIKTSHFISMTHTSTVIFISFLFSFEAQTRPGFFFFLFVSLSFF